jgi:hypothetical protein
MSYILLANQAFKIILFVILIQNIQNHQSISNYSLPKFSINQNSPKLNLNLKEPTFQIISYQGLELFIPFIIIIMVDIINFDEEFMYSYFMEGTYPHINFIIKNFNCFKFNVQGDFNNLTTQAQHLLNKDHFNYYINPHNFNFNFNSIN